MIKYLPWPHMILFNHVKSMRHKAGKSHLPPDVGTASATSWQLLIWMLHDDLPPYSTSPNARKFFLLYETCLPFTSSQHSWIHPLELHYLSLIPFPLEETLNILRLWFHLPESPSLQAKCSQSLQLFLMPRGYEATQRAGHIVLDTFQLVIPLFIWDKQGWEYQSGWAVWGEGREGPSVHQLSDTGESAGPFSASIF